MTATARERERLGEMLRSGGEHRAQALELISTLKEEAEVFLKAQFERPLEVPFTVSTRSTHYPRTSDIRGCWCKECAEAFCVEVRNPAREWAVQCVHGAIDGNSGNIFQRCQRCFTWLDIPRIPYYIGEYRLSLKALGQVSPQEIWLAGRAGAESSGIAWLAVVADWKKAKKL